MALARDAEAFLMLQKHGASGGKLGLAEGTDSALPPYALPLSWPELDAILPDGGLPRGVIELTAPRALGGSTSVALAAVRAGQARNKDAWCAWLDPEGTLHAPGVIATRVDLSRMLVMRIPRGQVGRVAVKTVASGAFEVVVIDYDAVPMAETRGASVSAGAIRREHLLMRKLALAAEPRGTTVLLLTNTSRPRTMQWPVALRIELSRPGPGDLIVRVAKDKRGRIGLAKTIPFRSIFQAMG